MTTEEKRPNPGRQPGERGAGALLQRCGRAAVLVASMVAAAAGASKAQIPFKGYALGLGLNSAQSVLAPGGTFGLGRVRLMTSPVAGAFQFDIAYEQLATWTSTAGGGVVAGSLGQPTALDWLPLQDSLASGAHAVWRHRLDRLSVDARAGAFEVTAGRQSISWATTLFLTPADPFAPFDPSDPFRVYRAGVDALQVRAFPGPFAEVDAVVRPATVGATHPMTALGRAKLSVGAAELSAWGGALFDDPAGAIGITVTALGAALRGEGEVRHTGGRTVWRGALGVDRRFSVADRDLYLVAEVQHDGFGAASAGELTLVLGSSAAGRGELQVFGRDEVAGQATYQVHPLVSLETLTLWNARDHSVLLGPALSYSASGAATLRAGAFFGVGTSAPLTEYGAVPNTAYVSLAVFFGGP